MHGVGVPASDSQSHHFSHHSLDSVAEMVATAASATVTVSDIVGMIGTETGLSVQTAAMKVQWCVSPIDVLPTSRQPFPVTVFFLLASTIRQGRYAAHPGGVHISPWRVMPHFAPRRPRGVCFPSLQHPRGPKTTRRFNRARACTGSTTLPETEPARAGLRTVRAMLNAGWPALLAALSFLFTYHEPLRLHFR
jgi:hypothetical protein